MTALPSLKRRLPVIAGVYGVRLALAAALALPLVSIVEGAGMNRFERGDALLFEPTGLYLVELLRISAPELQAYAKNSTLLLIAAMAMLIAARAAEMTALAEPGKLALGNFVERSLRVVPRFLMISGLALLARALVVLLGAWVVETVAGMFEVQNSERTADLVALAVAALWLVPLAGISMLADLARAGVVLTHATVRQALGLGLTTLRRHAAPLAAAWAGPVIVSLALVAAGAVLTSYLDVSRPGSLRLVGVFALHQAIAFALVFLDAFWLSKALGSFSQPQPAGTPAHSDAPSDPSSDRAASLDA